GEAAGVRLAGVSLGGQRDRRAGFTLLNLGVLVIAEHVTAVGGRAVVDGCDKAGRVAQVLVVVGDAVEQIGLGVVVAGHRGGQGGLNGMAGAVELGPPFPLVAAALHVVVDMEHHFAVGVGVDDVLVAVGQRDGGLGGPAIVAGAVA